MLRLVIPSDGVERDRRPHYESKVGRLVTARWLAIDGLFKRFSPEDECARIQKAIARDLRLVGKPGPNEKPTKIR
jgi:hypothetical protein